MNNKDNKLPTPEEVLEDNGYIIDDLTEAGTILFRSPDFVTAIIGVSDDDRVIYDYEKMIEYLVTYEDQDYESATDWVCSDTIRALSYMSEPNKPIVMFPLMD